MSTTAVRDEALGMVPGLRDALRSLVGSAPARDETWRLAAVGRLRQLIETAEVALVREGWSGGCRASRRGARTTG